MTYADPKQYAPASGDRGGFFATIFNALRAGGAVRSGRTQATASEPLRFHGIPRVF